MLLNWGVGFDLRSFGEEAEIRLQVVLVEDLPKEVATGELLCKSRLLRTWGIMAL